MRSEAGAATQISRGRLREEHLSKLNIGCGRRFHSEWINIDLAPSDPSVMKCDIQKGLPFEPDQFDAIYHSHVLEHLERASALAFLRECHRVLRPGGIIRVVVPDLEQIVRGYLKWLQLARSGDPLAEANYDWMMLELYDQVVRKSPGGEMLMYLRSGRVTNIDLIKERCGEDIASLTYTAHATAPNGFAERLRPRRLRNMLSSKLRQMVAICLFPFEYGRSEALPFSQSGELHRWMYDQFSLTRLLKSAGFREIRMVSATESQIPNWTSYALDSGNDGRPHKPDSLFSEAEKP